MEKRYLIEDIEKALLISRKTYYNWEKAGKIPKAKRDPMNNYRYWTAADLKRLQRITRRA